MRRYRYIYWFMVALSVVLVTIFSPWHPERSRVVVHAASQQHLPEEAVSQERIIIERYVAKELSEESAGEVLEPEKETGMEEMPETENAEASIELVQPMGSQFVQVDRSYFDDALFIGDSRTVGLDIYGGLGGADVFADEGMSTFRIWKVQIPFGEQVECTLQEALEAKRYGKIYIMLGINELGYHFDKVIEKYRETVELVRQLQPEAIIYLQANLHVTEKYATYDPTFSNENINQINEAVASMADGQGTFYLDPNVLFDDEKGNLDPNYTSDEVHLKRQYYDGWIEWICQNAIIKTQTEMGNSMNGVAYTLKVGTNEQQGTVTANE